MRRNADTREQLTNPPHGVQEMQPRCQAFAAFGCEVKPDVKTCQLVERRARSYPREFLHSKYLQKIRGCFSTSSAASFYTRE